MRPMSLPLLVLALALSATPAARKPARDGGPTPAPDSGPAAVPDAGLLLAVDAGPPPAAVDAGPPAPKPAPLTHSEARRKWLATTPREQQLAQLNVTPMADWALMAATAINELGTYRARFRKQERVGDALEPANLIEVTVRPKPLALRLRYVDGPAATRQVLYASDARPNDLRLRDNGAARFLGAIWLDMHGSIVMKDTRYAVTDLGFGPLVGHVVDDIKTLSVLDERVPTFEGFDDSGLFCIRTVEPDGMHLFAPISKLCWDLALGLPVGIELTTKDGTVLERHRWSAVQPQLKVGPKEFDPDDI